MTFAVLAAVLGLVTVLVALYRDRTVLDTAPTTELGWDPLPSVADVRRTEFPLAVPGYEPAVVDEAMDALGHAYADLLAEAPAAVRARAYRRAAARLGHDPDALPGHLEAAPPVDGARSAFTAEADPLEPLRAAAALAVLDRKVRARPPAPRSEEPGRGAGAPADPAAAPGPGDAPAPEDGRPPGDGPAPDDAQGAPGAGPGERA